jgi:phosphopantothenoylcysteine decarboxylase/phosphopantothenate--cysteine ligase
VRGPLVNWLPDPVQPRDTDRPGITRTDVVSAAEMAEACKATRFRSCDVAIMSAAVADWRPAEPVATSKMEEEGQPLSGALHLGAHRGHPRVDGMHTSKPARCLVGFALETHDGLAHAQ